MINPKTFLLLRVQLYKPHQMAFDKIAQEQQQSITILFVCFPAMLGLMQLALCQENVFKTEPGVAKISFVKLQTVRL